MSMGGCGEASRTAGAQAADGPLGDGLREAGAELARARQSIARLEAALARLAHAPLAGSASALELARRARGAFGRALVTIVIPVFNKADYTLRCLEKLIENTPAELFEVVLVDNASTDATPQLLGQLGGDVQVLRNAENQGFVVACNQGAAAGQGKYVLLLNNDTAPQPGWLEELVAAAERDPKVGVVGSKLVYPNGDLQEAGGLVFRDASAWNHGRGDDPDRPEFNQACEVDYCSGASLLVRRDLWDRLGGLDLRYAPAYYEDTDLCFGARSLGFQVVYCPASVVVHYEGVTAGTDTGSGFKRYQAVNRDKFLHKWAEALRQQPEPPAVTGWRPRTASRQKLQAAARDRASILVVDPTLPAFDKASGSLRLFRLLELMRQEEWHVTYVARNGHGQHRYRKILEEMGIRVFASDPERLAQMGLYAPGPRADLGQILGERQFHLAWLSFFHVVEQYLPLLRALSPRTVCLADTVDVHYLREMRQADLAQDAEALARAQELRRRELLVYGKSDLVVTVTEADRQELLRRKVARPIEVVPNVHAPHAGPSRGFEGRRGLVFVGGFNHPPNVDAMTWFVSAVLPLVRERAPDLPLCIVGSHPPEAVRALAGQGIEVTGYVPETGPWLDAARVSVAPLRYGAGMKGKVGEALGRGLPVVTTPVGAEGMGLTHEEHVLIADGPRAFADAVLRLHQDRALWERLAAAGRRRIEERYAPERVTASLRALVDRVLSGAYRPERPEARTA